MLSAQYAIAYHLQNHPRTKLRPRLRHIKADCLTMAKMIPVNGLDTTSYKTALKNIHTTVARENTSSCRPNIVLERKPADINIKDKSVPRCTRTTFSQLRSGWCHLLRSIDETTLDRFIQTVETHPTMFPIFSTAQQNLPNSQLKISGPNPKMRPFTLANNRRRR